MFDRNIPTFPVLVGTLSGTCTCKNVSIFSLIGARSLVVLLLTKPTLSGLSAGTGGWTDTAPEVLSFSLSQLPKA